MLLFLASPSKAFPSHLVFYCLAQQVVRFPVTRSFPSSRIHRDIKNLVHFPFSFLLLHTYRELTHRLSPFPNPPSNRQKTIRSFIKVKTPVQSLDLSYVSVPLSIIPRTHLWAYITNHHTRFLSLHSRLYFYHPRSAIARDRQGSCDTNRRIHGHLPSTLLASVASATEILRGTRPFVEARSNSGSTRIAEIFDSLSTRPGGNCQ